MRHSPHCIEPHSSLSSKPTRQRIVRETVAGGRHFRQPHSSRWYLRRPGFILSASVVAIVPVLIIAPDIEVVPGLLARPAPVG